MEKYINANIVFSKFSRDYMELKKELPIRPSEMGVLNIITRREGRFTPLMIAEFLGVSKPMIVAHISVLEEKEYIYKEPSIEDNRSFYVLPTEKAKALVAEAEEKLNEHLKAIENNLGEKQENQRWICSSPPRLYLCRIAYQESKHSSSDSLRCIYDSRATGSI